MGLIGLLRRKKKIVEEPIEEPQAKASKGPELFVLVPEIAGAPTYHVNRFPNGDDGTQFIDESLSPVSRTGSHIFWALHEGPSSDIASNVDSGEALVLIRSARNVDTVHIVSFVDIESAQSFARFEVKRGLALDLLMIYWAAFAQVIETPFGLRLDPPEPPVYEAASPAVPAPPPAAANGHAPAGDSAATSDEASLSDEDLGPELRIMPEPDVKPSRDETRDPPPRLYLEDPPTLTEEEDEPELVTGSLDTDELSPEASAESPVAPDASIDLEPTEPVAEPAAIEPAQETDESEPPLAVEDAPDDVESVTEPVAVEHSQETDESEPPLAVEDAPDDIETVEPPADEAEEPLLADEGEQGDIEPVESAAGHQPPSDEAESLLADEDVPAPTDEGAAVLGAEETLTSGVTEKVDAPSGEATESTDEQVIAEEGSDAGEVAQRTSAEPGTELDSDAEPEAANGLAPEPDDDDPVDGDRAKAEIQRILKVRRWEKRSKPFSGFDSPPGRF